MTPSQLWEEWLSTRKIYAFKSISEAQRLYGTFVRIVSTGAVVCELPFSTSCRDCKNFRQVLGYKQRTFSGFYAKEGEEGFAVFCFECKEDRERFVSDELVKMYTRLWDLADKGNHIHRPETI